MGLNKSFGSVTVAEDVTISLRDASVHGLIGPNGAGKTTLLNMITGYVRPDSGTVRLGDITLGRTRPHARSRRGIARTFQTPRLLEDLTVGENILLGRRASHRGWRFAAADADDRLRVAEFAELLGVDHHLATAAKALPPGERRIVEVARALASEPSVVLLDEPFAGLTPPEVRRLREVVARLRDEWGLAVLLIEHNLPEVFAVCDEVTVLEWGKVVAAGSVTSVANSDTVKDIFFGGHNAQEPTIAAPRQRDSADSPRLECRELRAGYGRLEVVHQVDLAVHAAEIVSIVGVNGAGKTTLLRALSGHRPLMGGELLVDGTSVGSAPSTTQLVRDGVCLVPDGRHLFTSLPVAANLELAGTSAGMSGDATEQRMKDVLAFFPSVVPHLDRPAGALSGGQQQLVAIARALMTSPTVLLLDEPSTGLSLAALDELVPVLQRLRDEQGLSIVMAEQNLAFASRLAQRSVLISQGTATELDDDTDLGDIWESMSTATPAPPA